MIFVEDEFSKLERVIIGLGSPYLRDRKRIAAEMQEYPLVPDTARKAEVLALEYPDEELLQREYADYVARLQKYGVDVLRADPGAAYSFDYTCPRDIGFVVGDIFFVANMSVDSRREEFKTIEHHLRDIDARKIVRPPENSLIEGGDVIVLDRKTVLVGINQRTSVDGFAFLNACLVPLGIEVIPVRHNRLHLDCCLNPLGRGHLLIHPASLPENEAATWQALEKFQWIQVDDVEREHLATNILSIDPGTVIARDHESCRRVNQALIGSGYTLETVGFDGVPATGGSFRCASLALTRFSS
jgi:N-dimethylarginine dimethylaminohydrolase